MLLLSMLLNLFISRRGYTILPDLVYGDLQRNRFDLYVPENLGTSAPLLIFFYGGAWSVGSKALYRFIGQAFASKGYLVAIPDYRLYPEVIFPAFMTDAAKAVSTIASTVHSKYGKEHPLFLAGHSAGAHIALLLTLDKHYLADAGFSRDKISGSIGLSGPYDFLPLKEARYKAIFPEDVRPASQPINFVEGGEPSLLLLTGDTDTIVKPGNTARLANKVRERGGSAETRLYPGIGHFGTIIALIKRWPFRKPPVKQDIFDFIAAQTARRTLQEK